MPKKTIFLAGPLTGVSYKDALEWRKYVESKLPAEIIAFSALRGKTYITKEYLLKDAYPEHLLSTPQGTITRDRYDVSRCDALFVNLLDTDKVSIGTIMEMAWADARRIPVILAMKDGNIHDHAFVRQVAAFITGDLDEAIQTAVDVVITRVV
jgi:nucleoside 2-deoxyribosyltransferase